MSDKKQNYLTPVRVGYIERDAVEKAHGKDFATLLRKLAIDVEPEEYGGTHTIHFDFESFWDHVEELQADRELTPEQMTFLESFRDKCRAMNCTGDLVIV